jgi:hypothetical protein
MRAIAILLVLFVSFSLNTGGTSPAVGQLQGMPRFSTSLPESSFAGGLQR